MKRTPKLRSMTAHNNLHALLFQATSAEYIALCVQMYQLARHALMGRLNGGTFRNPAVIFDLDETLLDNSSYAAWQIQAGTNFDEKSTWTEWCHAGQAGAVPGGLEFARFAREAGVTPIFITSRLNECRAGTARNLHQLGLLSPKELKKEAAKKAITDPEHARKTRLFMKGMPEVEVPESSGPKVYKLGNKFLQRVFCTQVLGYEIILSIGDNLSDYAEYYGRVFDEDGTPTGKFPGTASRRASALQDSNLFGRDFILIPNVTYGGWLAAFELNGLGASDELAQTGAPVRESLKEPRDPFTYQGPKGIETVTPVGPKFTAPEMRVWKGPKV